MFKKISLLLLVIFSLSFNSLAKDSCCTPEVKEKGMFATTELECKLIQLVINYINLNIIDLNIDTIIPYIKEYKPYYKTVTFFKSKEQKPWDIKTYMLIVWFDEDFNIVKIQSNLK